MTEEQIAQMEKLADLHEKGILTDEEFNAQKKRLLESSSVGSDGGGSGVGGAAFASYAQANYNDFLTSHANYFNPLQMGDLNERIRLADESKRGQLPLVDLKKPSTMFWIAFFLGAFGADRFMLGQTGIGFLKLFVGWCSCGIWWLGDLFTIKKRTWEYNYNAVVSVLQK